MRSSTIKMATNSALVRPRLMMPSVIDYARYGQIMNWDTETLKFRPCIAAKNEFSETDIQKILRDCVRGLDYRNRQSYLRH